jgi:RNA polymerase sigma-70 factor (ECF subfamily)
MAAGESLGWAINAAFLTAPKPAPVASEITSLTSRMVRSEELAFREFYDHYASRLLGYLLVAAKGQEQLARDALQLTLLRVVRHIRIFDAEEQFWSWLTVLARSSVVDEQRKLGRYLGFLQRLWNSNHVDNAPSHDQSSDLAALLEASLESLGEDDKQLLESKYFNGDSVREISGRCGASEKAIESRLTRVREKLKRQILLRLKVENEN